MDEDDAITSLNANYVKHFQNHVADFFAYLNGTDHTHGRMRPSFYEPCGYWSPEDKDRFFHALSVHSRFRPDLIAAEIPGKTTVDICIYLQLLAERSAESPKTWRRSAFPAAFETSDEWIEFEEKQARAMTTMEPVWEAEDREDRRANALRAERRALRKQRAPYRGTRDREEEKRHNTIFKELRAKQEARWEREDYIGELTPVHLKAIDNILREAEESSAYVVTDRGVDILSWGRTGGSAESLEDAVTNITETFVSSLVSVQQEHSQDPGEKDRPQAGTPSNTVSKRSVIPAHIALASNEEADLRVAENNLDNTQSDTFDGPGTLSPRSRRRYQKRLYMRRKRAAQSGRAPEIVVKRLKPGRKTNKKLLREQALQRAKSAEVEDTQEDVDTNEASFTIPLEKEDEKQEYFNIFEGKEEFEIPLGAISDSSKQEPSNNVRRERELAPLHANIGGLTLPYKTKKELLLLNYDAQTLETEGLDLFHLSKLADLMNLQACLQKYEDNACQNISGFLIKLLRTEIVLFVTDLAHRVIAIHEQEQLSKRQTKVWRMREEQITAGTVRRALETMGATTDKKQRFALWLSTMAPSGEPVEQSFERRDREDESRRHGGVGVSDLNSENNEVGRIEGDNSNLDEEANLELAMFIRSGEPAVHLQHEIYAPFMWHPSLDHLDPDPLLSSQTLLAADEDGDTALDVPDGSKLAYELLEEDEIDAIDLAAARRAEQELWKEIGIDQSGQGAPESELPDRSGEYEGETVGSDTVATTVGRKRHRHISRFGVSKRTKSRVYVVDSD